MWGYFPLVDDEEYEFALWVYQARQYYRAIINDASPKLNWLHKGCNGLYSHYAAIDSYLS